MDEDPPVTLAPEAQETSRHPSRVTSLDGLRGVAAFVVVLHHICLAGAPSLIYGYESVPGLSAPATGSPRWWISSTPLHIFWAGPEMVLVFFVLSGYVLALPAVKRGRHWFDAAYYPRRVLRLYLPALGALVLAGIVHAIPAHNSVVGASLWLNGHAVPLRLSDGVKNATLLSQGSTAAYTTVLWSLQWEVEFSLLLPAALAVVLVTRDRPWLALLLVCICLALIELGTDGGSSVKGTLHYLAIFELGSLLAMHIDRLPDLSRANRWQGILLLVATVCLLTTTYWTQSTGAIAAGRAGTGLPVIGATLGAGCAVWLAARHPLVGRALSGRVIDWLGTRSFSLYLVHEPIVVALAFALGGRPEVIVLAVIAIPVALLVTEVFWRAVEHPSVMIARAAGQGALRLIAPLALRLAD